MVDLQGRGASGRTPLPAYPPQLPAKYAECRGFPAQGRQGFPRGTSLEGSDGAGEPLPCGRGAPRPRDLAAVIRAAIPPFVHGSWQAVDLAYRCSDAHGILYLAKPSIKKIA